MQTVSFSELRNNAKKYFDRVERGESLEIYRNGKPIAILAPAKAHSLDRWKTAHPKTIPGVSLSRAILAERAERE